LCVKSEVLQFFKHSLHSPFSAIDPIDLLPHNIGAKRVFMLSIIKFSTIVNGINFCAITFLQRIYGISSGVARVPCALGQEIILRVLSTKTTGF